MTKPIQRHELEIKALQNGASAMLFVIEEVDVGDPVSKSFPYYITHKDYSTEVVTEHMLIRRYSPLQVSDAFYVQEYFIDKKDGDFGNLHYLASATDADIYWLEEDLGLTWRVPSFMTCKQSRFKGTVKSVGVKRVQELSVDEINEIGFINGKSYGFFYDWFKDWIDSIHGEGTYEVNPYVFIVGVE